MRFAVITIAVLALAQLNSPTPILEPHRVAKSNEVVADFVKGQGQIATPLFPDRSKEAQDAKQNDINKVIAEQARLAQLEATQKAQVVVSTNNVQKTATGLPNGVEQLKQCESGGNYATNTGNGYYGAYQYDISSWNNYGGYARPDLAPPEVQDAKFLETYNRRGASPWPVCGRFL